jgi:hypothetical protein
VILYLAADLLWASKIKATGEAVGVACRPVRTLEMLDARLADSPVRAIMLDLDSADTALAMIARLRGPTATDQTRSVRILAFGPHVAKELFQQARDAGADDVMPRGALDHHMEDIMLKLESGAGR